MATTPAPAPIAAPAEERLTPFMIFYCEQKPLVMCAYPNAPPNEISKLVYLRWKSLTQEQTRGYSVLSATYTESKKSQQAPVRRKRVRDKAAGAPKAATSAYMYYSASATFPSARSPG